jgi:hypothetical protein
MWIVVAEFRAFERSAGVSEEATFVPSSGDID